MANLFYRTTAEVYEGTRQALDVALGNPGRFAITCLRPIEEAVTDEQGRVYLAVQEYMFAWPAVQAQASWLIQAGLVEEITESEYLIPMPQTDL